MNNRIKTTLFPIILIILIVGIFGLLGANLNNIMNMGHNNCLGIILQGNDCPVANFLALTGHHLSILQNLTQTTIPQSLNFLAFILLVIFIFLKSASLQLIFYLLKKTWYKRPQLESISRQLYRIIYWLSFHNKGSILPLFKDV